MPGKVNPSVPEMVNQVCYQVYGCDATVTVAADAGQLELNVMMPVIAWNVLHAQKILTAAMATLRERTIGGMEADRDRARELLDRSTAVATALSPYLDTRSQRRSRRRRSRAGEPFAMSCSTDGC